MEAEHSPTQVLLEGGGWGQWQCVVGPPPSLPLKPNDIIHQNTYMPRLLPISYITYISSSCRDALLNIMPLATPSSLRSCYAMMKRQHTRVISLRRHIFFFFFFFAAAKREPLSAAYKPSFFAIFYFLRAQFPLALRLLPSFSSLCRRCLLFALSFAIYAAAIFPSFDDATMP